MIWAIICLIFLNGYFVAAEFALVRLHSAPTHRYLEGGGLRGRIIRRMLGDLDTYLSTAQLGITFTSITLGSVGEPYVSAILEHQFERFIPGISAYGDGISIGLSLALITMIQIIIGEQAPKSYGIKAYERVTGLTAIPMQVIYILFYPLIWVINMGSLVILRVLGVSQDMLDRGMTEEELQVLLVQSHNFGSISERERRIMTNAMKLEDMEARDVMVPRPDVSTIDANATVGAARKIILETGHSRIPVVDPDLDHCVGVLYAKDLLEPDVNEESLVSNLVRQASYVPETISGERLLYLFQSRGLHIAITIDEFGGASGIVTLEDVLEELVGEIKDEYDPDPAQQLRKMGEGRWRGTGMARLEDVEHALGVEFETDQDTLSGWFIAAKDGFPKRGDLLDHEGFRFVVESIERHRIASLMIERLPEDADEKPESAG